MVEYNSTMTVAEASFSISSGLPLIAITIGIVLLIGYLMFDEKNYLKIKNFLKKFEKIKKTLTYFLSGAVTIGIVSCLYGLITLFANEASAGFPVIKFFGAIIAGYAITCIIGIPLHKLVERIISFEEKTNKRKKK